MRGASWETAFLERGSLYPTYLMFIPSRISPSCLLPSKVHPSSYLCFLPTLPTCSAFTLPTGPPKPPKNSRLEGPQGVAVHLSGSPPAPRSPWWAFLGQRSALPSWPQISQKPHAS